MSRRNQVENFWNQQPPELSSMLLHHPYIDSLERPEILSLLPPFTQVLDLGAGIGRFTAEFAKTAKKVTALDLSPSFIEANRRANNSFENIEWRVSDAMDAEFPNQSFDLVFISWLFMYLDDVEVKILSSRIRRWLKPRGVLFFRESCAAKTESRLDGYYVHYRSPLAYDRIFFNWTFLKTGNIQAYQDLEADPFKCYWLLQK